MRRQWVLLALLVVLLTYRETPVAAAASGPGGTWIVDPADPGPDLPPAGRSLFDFLVTDHSGPEPVYRIPFPFSALRDRLAEQLRNDPHGTPAIKQVLIPLGRSLQRTAATPEFFRFPRVVLAVDGEPAPDPGVTGMFLKDRLYIGYLEKASVLEVISYNEAAGRFEFQIVSDYRAGGRPMVAYANRAICTACHQNATPIFSRPLWGETNANHQIATLLQEEERDFYGIPASTGVDIPNAIDDATDRANLIPALQFIWEQACDADPNSLVARLCRGQALRFALQYRLSGSLQFARADNPDWQQFTAPLQSRWQARWPRGLLVSSPDIPNRIPVAAIEPVTVPGAIRSSRARPAEQEQLLQQLHVPSQFDPLRPRPPLDTWTAAGSAEHFVTGLADFFAEVDIERLDRHLFEHEISASSGRSQHHSDCTLTPRHRTADETRISLRCDAPDHDAAGPFSMSGRVYLHGNKVVRGTIDRLVWGDDTAVQTDLAVSAGELDRQSDTARLTLQLSREALHARGPNGNALEDIQISWKNQVLSAGTEELPSPIRGQAVLTLREDFQIVRKAIEALSETRGDTLDAFSSKPFRRVTFLNALHRRLGMPDMRSCCVDARRLPPLAADAYPDDVTLQQLVAAAPGIPELGFYRHCSTCHRSRERFPPNFLHGKPSQVRDTLAHCAERLYVRLHMWNLPLATRAKTPMPPEHALEQLGLNAATWQNSPELGKLQTYARDLLQSETGSTPVLEDLIARDYENLRPCLAAP